MAASGRKPTIANCTSNSVKKRSGRPQYEGPLEMLSFVVEHEFVIARRRKDYGHFSISIFDRYSHLVPRSNHRNNLVRKAAGLAFGRHFSSRCSCMACPCAGCPLPADILGGRQTHAGAIDRIFRRHPAWHCARRHEGPLLAYSVEKLCFARVPKIREEFV